MKRFTEMKRNNSFGPISESDLERYAANFLPPPRTGTYSSWTRTLASGKTVDVWSSYNRKYPFTYRKTGELESKMKKKTQYQYLYMNPDTRTIRVIIPLKTRNVKTPEDMYTYQFLEEERSFIKASFLLSWKEILLNIMEKIGK
jgi:hypothetical protein